MIAANKTYCNFYTIIELLVVLVIVGIIFGVSMAGLTRMAGRQGESGAVRTLSSQLSLARSYAVVKNKYVALLLPDRSICTDKFDTPVLQPYLHTKTRICLVKNFDSTASFPATPVAVFDSWLDGNEWESMPDGACAAIDDAGVAQVTDIAFDGNSGLKSSAIIFKSSGVVAGGKTATISVSMGKYIPGKGLVYETKSGPRFGWDITVNPYTGRTGYEKQSN